MAKAETKEVVAKKEVVNEKKTNDIVGTIQEVNALYLEAGINVYNPQGKDAYRIMGGKGGSSLNLKKTKYVIYTTDTDFELVKDTKVDGVIVEEGTNKSDHSRPNTVICNNTEALKAILKVYATNAFNQVKATA